MGETSPKKIIHNVREKYGETVTRSLVSQIRAQMRDDGVNIPKAEPHKGGQTQMDVGYEGFKISKVVTVQRLVV